MPITDERRPMPRPRIAFLSKVLLFAVAALGLSAVSVRAQVPDNFLADHYDISASLDPGGQSLTATAKVDFVAQQASGVLRVELHPNLTVSAVKEDGKPLAFQRDATNALGLVVTLPTQVASGGKVSLEFTYAGILANEENSPIPGVKVASISHDGAYLLLPARWFPLTGYPTHAYTGIFRINVPDTFAVAGTGKSVAAPTPMPAKLAGESGRLQYEFHCDRPGLHGSFVAGALQLNPQQAQGISVAVYAPHTEASTAPGFAADVARSVTTFSDLFGPIPDPTFTVAQLPDGTIGDFAGPGLLLVAKRYWDPKNSDRTIARLVASQWWGEQVLPKTTSDVWLTDGLARYSEALYEEQSAGQEAGLRAVDEFAVGSLMYEGATPISQEARLSPYTSQYRSIVMDKGAMVFHMLRAQMGDAPFKALLHDFYFRFAENRASISDFEALAQKHEQAALKPGETPPNLGGFFAQWLDSTGVPDFTLEYVVYRTPKGFRVVGKIKQPLDTFSMPVQLRIDTEGNPETKMVQVTGTETSFDLETFGRPKPNGIHIDPNNLILKGSTSLRARAAIARGEELAGSGKYYDAIQQYQKALQIQPGRPLANFRMGEAFFYQKNYNAAANAFREALAAVPEPSEKWTEVWGHIYLGKIFDLLGQRARAVNEYSKAKQTNDNTSGAQQTAEALLKKPYSESLQTAPSASGDAQAGADPKPKTQTPPADDGRPTLKKPQP